MTSYEGQANQVMGDGLMRELMIGESESEDDLETSSMNSNGIDSYCYLSLVRERLRVSIDKAWSSGVSISIVGQYHGYILGRIV